MKGENVLMHTIQRIWRYFQQHRMASIVAAHICVLLMVGLLVLGGTLGPRLLGVFAKAPCASGDSAYTVVSGNTLGEIAARYHTTWERLASYNHLANPNLIYVHQVICIPGAHTTSGGPTATRGTGNYFPYGQCTWWAAQRYYELRHVYVPWTTNSNAWEWTARAYQFHWHVSGRPSVGAIVDLQPWVQGAYGLGHVAVVERVLSNGSVIASNMNWGTYYWEVTDVEFSPGPGVSFITY
jgi:N-acetylmuramoyl-L-alanine amidase